MAENITSPKVTVLMAVYNGEKYLADAISSILKQTFTDIEFLIINDGSTDKSSSIINSFNDGRINLVNNEKNLGLISSLNIGIRLAKGEYIARMDCDDISVPERLDKQVKFLDTNPNVSVVAARVRLMNADGEETGNWDSDIYANSSNEIYDTLPKENCIAHPSVVMRKSLAEKYLYRSGQKNVEDWDLWLRMSADGLRIEKINEVLLKYRIHFDSVTMNKNTPESSQKKVNKCKQRFLTFQASKLKINGFFFKVLYSWMRGLARYWKLYVIPDFLRAIKRIITTNPFKVYADFLRLKNYLNTHSHNLIFFFPYVHVGGAERVHSDILECIKDKNPLVFITGFSNNKLFLPKFERSSRVFDIPEVLNYLTISAKAKKMIVDYINSQNDSKTMGCNSVFYYELLPSLSPETKCMDLKHSFIYPDNGAEKALLFSAMQLEKRVFISKKAIENCIHFYHENNVPKNFSERLIYIPNFVDVRAEMPEKQSGEKLNVIYVGRGTPEKRAYLVAQIATECKKQNIPAKFKMVGDVSAAVDKSTYPYIDFTGEITDEDRLEAVYCGADVLLITSTTEGFPMAIMEAMANGVVPISSNVGDVPLHVINKQTGYVTSGNDAGIVVSEMVAIIKNLSENRYLLKSLSVNAYIHAKNNFSKNNFCRAYQNLFGS